MVDKAPTTEITIPELAAALEKWEIDAAANSWSERTDKERFNDKADYLIHTIRIARGEGSQEPKED